MANFSRSPWLSGSTIQGHVHPLKHKPPLGIVYVYNAFHAKNIGPFGLDQLIEPAVEPVAVHCAGFGKGNGVNRIIVLVGGVIQEFWVNAQGIFEVECTYSQN